MAETILTLPEGDAKPTGFTRFGGRLIVCYEDLRPMVLMADGNGAVRAYRAGIKAPLTAPTVQMANELVPGTPLSGDGYLAYAFYSSTRRVMSEMSPVAKVALEGRRFHVSGFENPRDGALTQAIDTILVALQLEGAPGLMCLPRLMSLKAQDGDFMAKSLTFSIAPDELAYGFNLSEASKFAAVPPAFQFCERVGERVWYGGQRERADFEGTALRVEGVEPAGGTAAPNFRGRVCAKLTLAGPATFNDAHLTMSLHAGGEMLGFIYDIADSKTAYLDRNLTVVDGQHVERALTLTTGDFHLRGVRDRIYPSSFHGFTLGNVPTAWPECVNLANAYSFPEMNDEAQTVRGLRRSGQGLAVFLSGGVVEMTGGHEAGLAQPQFTPVAGAAGCVSVRSVVQTAAGGLAWLSGRGPEVLDGAGVGHPASATGCNRLFGGQEWIDPACLAEAVMAPMRDFEGLAIGNLVVDGRSGCWLLFTTQPQTGFWLMDGQEMTSNILEYGDGCGRSVLLVGDGRGGRVKRLLAPSVLEDAQPEGEGAAPYRWAWRGGWDSSEGAKRTVAQFLTVDGLVVPGPGAELTLTLWRHNFPVRHPADVPGANTHVTTIGERDLQFEIPLRPGSWRYHSLEISGASASGSSEGRPVELARWSLVFQEAGRSR